MPIREWSLYRFDIGSGIDRSRPQGLKPLFLLGGNARAEARACLRYMRWRGVIRDGRAIIGSAGAIRGAGGDAIFGRCLGAADFLDDSVGSQDWFCEGEVVVDFCLRTDPVEVA
jgi:hypothetical protein